jgi:hypothetical protein
VVERTVGIHQDLPAPAGDVLELRHELPEIGGRQGEQKPIAGPVRRSFHTLNDIPIAGAIGVLRRRLTGSGSSAG